MTIDFEKCGGLVPAIVQDALTGKVLMLGYMNAESYARTQETGRVCFYSRSRQCLWTKGETSGNYLTVQSIKVDCDHDTLLIQAIPQGPVCHTGTDTCWGEKNEANTLMFLTELQDFINNDFFGELYYAKATYLRRKGNPGGWFGNKELSVKVIGLVAEASRL